MVKQNGETTLRQVDKLSIKRATKLGLNNKTLDGNFSSNIGNKWQQREPQKVKWLRINKTNRLVVD